MDSWFELSRNFGPVQILITEQNIRFNICWCLTAACDYFLIKYQTKKKEIKINNDNRAMHWFNLNLGPKMLSPDFGRICTDQIHATYWPSIRTTFLILIGQFSGPELRLEFSSNLQFEIFGLLFLQKPNSSENFDSWVLQKSVAVTSKKTEISEKILDEFSRICQ